MPPEDDRPATKRDVDQLRTELRGEMGQLRIELRGKMGELRTELHADMDRLRNDLIESMRDMQTEILRAFHSWARPVEIRLRAVDDMQQRLGLLEERVGNIERGKTAS